MTPAVFVGGIRALLLQAAHPEVAAGVFEHSRYREDPLGRLTRTAAYVTATSFGAGPEVERAIAVVRRRHVPVHGRSHRGAAYDAADPALDAWVHNSLTDSFLTAYQVYGAGRHRETHADRYVAEQTRVGRLLGADPLPPTAAELTAWIAEHPALGASPGSHQAIRFLRRPPLPGRRGADISFCSGPQPRPCPSASARSSACPPGRAISRWVASPWWRCGGPWAPRRTGSWRCGGPEEHRHRGSVSANPPAAGTWTRP